MKCPHPEMQDSYQDLVFLNYSNAINNTPFEIKNEVVVRGHIISPYSIPVCENINENLLWMGFAHMFIYDQAHFEAHLYAPLDKDHGHNGTLDDLQKLPQMLNNPIAVLTADRERKETQDGAYKPLVLLSCDQQTNPPIYRMAVVHPQHYYFGTTESYNAAKVITYYSIDESKFNSMLMGAISGRNDLLYFDTTQYRSIRSPNKLPVFENHNFKTEKIYDHFTPIKNLDHTIRMHQKAIFDAADVTIQRYGDNAFIQQDTEFTPFEEAIKTLESKTATMRDLLSAREIVNRTCKLASDPFSIQKTIEKTDVLFAKAYTRVMQGQDQFIQSANAYIQNIADHVRSEDDMDVLYDEIEKMTGSAITLKNLGITFSSSVASDPAVLKAHEISGTIENALAFHFQKIITATYDKIDRQVQQDIEIGNH